MYPRATLVVAFALLACGDDSHGAADAESDATTADAIPLHCVSFSEAVTCPEAGASDAATCPSPQGIMFMDGGFPVGCVVIENDQSAPIDGACVTPVYTCVAGTPPAWQAAVK